MNENNELTNTIRNWKSGIVIWIFHSKYSKSEKDCQSNSYSYEQ